MKVYLLSHYDEDGSSDVMATLDKGKLPNMPTKLGYGDRPKALETLEQLIQKDEIDTFGSDLEGGWGGAMLHIVELD